MISTALLLAMLGQDVAATPVFEPRPFAQAWQDFERLCVTPLPSPVAFTEAMRGGNWQRVRKSPEQVYGTGNSWRSPIGQVTYHYNERIVHVIGGPACHLEFRTDAGFRHDEAAATMQRQLGLPQGTNSGRRGAPQMRWEMRRPDGVDIRVFLTSNVAVPGGTGARLSISRRNLAPLPREMAGR